MILKYNLEIKEQAIHYNLKRIINQVYKLLPMRQEQKDWEKPLQTIIEQLVGMKKIILKQDSLFLLIICKLEGLFRLKQEQNMALYRRTIFECLSLLNNLNNNVEYN